MDREERLLAIIDAQTRIVTSRLDVVAVMDLITDHARALTGADAAVLELADGERTVYTDGNGNGNGNGGASAPPPSASEATSTVRVPLVHVGDTVGALHVLDARPDRFGPEDEETLTLLSGVLSAHLQTAETFARHRRESRQDPLTGIGNRRAYDERIAEEVATAYAAGAPFSLMLLDVDFLKDVNDGYGHPAGDQMLQTVARVLCETARATDGHPGQRDGGVHARNVFRIGGDEFAVLLAGTAEEEAEAIAARFAVALAKHRTPLGPMRASCGVAGMLAADPLVLHAEADLNLYDAKISRALG